MQINGFEAMLEMDMKSSYHFLSPVRLKRLPVWSVSRIDIHLLEATTPRMPVVYSFPRPMRAVVKSSVPIVTTRCDY